LLSTSLGPSTEDVGNSEIFRWTFWSH